MVCTGKPSKKAVTCYMHAYTQTCFSGSGSHKMFVGDDDDTKEEKRAKKSFKTEKGEEERRREGEREKGREKRPPRAHPL